MSVHDIDSSSPWSHDSVEYDTGDIDMGPSLKSLVVVTKKK